MRPVPALPFALALAGLALAGCAASDEDFPSLALRPAELNRTMEPPVREPLKVESDPALVRRINELAGRARAGERAFAAALGPAESAVRAAGPSQSEGWVEAQLKLSALEAARVETVTALGDMDQLAVARADQATNQDDFDALQAAIAEAEQLAAGQQAHVDRLRARLQGA